MGGNMTNDAYVPTDLSGFYSGYMEYSAEERASDPFAKREYDRRQPFYVRPSRTPMDIMQPFRGRGLDTPVENMDAAQIVPYGQAKKSADIDAKSAQKSAIGSNNNGNDDNRGLITQVSELIASSGVTPEVIGGLYKMIFLLFIIVAIMLALTVHIGTKLGCLMDMYRDRLKVGEIVTTSK